MVRPEGFEPPTVRVEAEYSIHLSYGRVLVREAGLEPAIHARRLILSQLCIPFHHSR